SGAVVATLRGAVVRRGSFTLGPVDLQVDWGDRVAITGANGSGKSTLLAALLGRLPPDEGASSLGPGLVVGERDPGGALLRAARGRLPRRVGAAPGGRADAAGEVRPAGGARRATGRHPVPRRADPRSAR